MWYSYHWCEMNVIRVCQLLSTYFSNKLLTKHLSGSRNTKSFLVWGWVSGASNFPWIFSYCLLNKFLSYFIINNSHNFLIKKKQKKRNYLKFRNLFGVTKHRLIWLICSVYGRSDFLPNWLLLKATKTLPTIAHTPRIPHQPQNPTLSLVQRVLCRALWLHMYK